MKLRQIALGPPQALDVTVERCGWPVPNYCHGTDSILTAAGIEPWDSMSRAETGHGPSPRHQSSLLSMQKSGVYCFDLVKLAINERTHVVPPSFEYDSSYWCESGLMLDHMALTRIVLSFTVS